MTEAYKQVMLSPLDAKTISKAALQKRIIRFFRTVRMREAMAATTGERGEKARCTFEKIQKTEQAQAKKEFSQSTKQLPSEDDNSQKLWLESLKMTSDPTAMSIYGTGLFLIQMAVSQIVKRKKEIEVQNISALDKAGSPYTSLDLNAIKTAAAMILPFAPPPTTAERRAMALAGVLVGLTPDEIKEDPDAYTAQPPNTIETTGKAHE